MKKPKNPKKSGLVMDSVLPSGDNRFQVSRSLPDLRDRPMSTAVSTIGFEATHPKKPSKVTRNLNPQDIEKKPKKKRNKKKIFKRLLLLILIIILAVGGWLGYKALKDTGKLGTNIFSIFDNSKLKGEDSGHINILLAGNSTDDPGHSGALLTDSIMVLSINTVNHTAFMLSVPRDLYVNIPNNGYSRINAAYEYGEDQNFSAAGYPKGGMGQLEQVVSKKLGIPIHYYALINYAAFRDSVNAVGGITVNIGNAPYGLYDPYAGLNLKSGTQQINGVQALALARSRGDGPGAYGVTSDFDRAMEQRVMLLALKDKASSVGVLANPVKLANLFDAAGNNVKTDMSLGNIKRLNSLTKNIPDSKVTSAGLSTAPKGYLAFYNANGSSVLIPLAGIDDYTAIQAYVKTLQGPTTTSTAK